ncbi:uncharacterized protein DUF1311 [Methylobacter tundripaludum]|uniref:Uncharacterized protein DUF1311 n=1 Tax=Methylobacter tundripaludum TaxID=173365 RepID=A0A2S6H935_9GAMM|nr:lysozyme inhibitor LprI family protein [Methylobacter tundripaludum]PPK73941.1 uncharacterized protein DUF1311 [Methylobacter tundripaludum]
MTKSKPTASVVQIALGCFLLVLHAPEIDARGRCELVPESWAPSLEQVSGYLEEAAKADTKASQQTLNQNSQNLADICDAQLYILYIELMQRLDARGQAELFKEQKRWLGKRVDYAQSAVVSKGGSLAPLEYNGAYKKYTEDRLLQLQKRLQQQPKLKSSEK